MKKVVLFLGLIVGSFHLSHAQTADEVRKITSSYDQNQLESLAIQYQQAYQLQRERAILAAQARHQPLIIDENGRRKELQAVLPNGAFLYYTTFNADASKSTRTNFLNIGGGLGLSLMGQNMTAHIWDAALARSSHQEYHGAGGNNRYSIGDGTSALHAHSAHVAGTIMASGVNAQAKGMAPYANAMGYDWNNDLSEATNAANTKGMLISSHSYGYDASQPGFPAQYFGAYIGESRNWDNLQFNAPYYLMVVAAGNDGTVNYNTQPLDGKTGYDKLTGHSTSKNNLVIANARDANIDSNGNLVSVVIEPSSSQGPTDDYRIKPDLAGNGYLVYSTLQNANNAYGNMTGTSMATPNVSGTLLLLQEHYKNVNSNYMKAATLKGLVLHTADDAGPIGPDAVWGWGLMNAKRAAETITNNTTSSRIQELTLSQGQNYTFTVTSDGINPLIASISWTDRPGTAVTTTNNHTPVLVNDLDIRITKGGTTYFPWKLTGVTTNGKGDNNVDPFERIDIPGASGNYTISITHKGNLSGGSQNYSLIITGLSIGNCTGMPTAGTAFSTDNPVCPSKPFSLSSTGASALSGITYQWQQSPAGANSWTDIAGATTLNYSVGSGITSPTDYRLIVSCTNSGQSQISNTVAVGIKSIQECYCNVDGISTVEPITKVTFAGIDNSSPVNSTLAYEDFRMISGNVEAGNSYTFSVEGYTGGNYVNTFSLFIDWNQDGFFNNTTERYDIGFISNSTGLDGKKATASISVPATAMAGTTRMRVIKQYSNPNPPYQYAIDGCEAGSPWGQAEDYSLVVSQACSAGLLSVSADTTCSNELGEINVIGNSNTTQLNLYANLGDPTPTQIMSGNSATFFVSATVDTYFYVSASNGSCESPKVPILLHVAPAPDSFVIQRTDFPLGADECSIIYSQLSTGEPIYSTLFNEDFTPNYSWGYGGADTNKIKLALNSSNNSGGNAPELVLYSVTPSNSSSGNWFFVPVDESLNRIAIDASGYSELQFNFKHKFETLPGSYQRNLYLDISTDGVNFTPIWSRTGLTSNIPATAVQVDLSAYDGIAQLYFQFRYNGASKGIKNWWIDDVQISGNKNPVAATWSPIQGLFVDENLSIPYSGASTSTVYAAPHGIETYTATVYSSDHACSVQQSEVVSNSNLQFNASLGNWDEALNWTPNYVPNLNSCVKIPSGKNAVVNSTLAEAKRVRIDAGGSLLISANQALTIVNEIDNQAGADHFVVEDGANLAQINDAAVNVGEIKLKKQFTFTPLRKEYNFVSVPTSGFNVKNTYEGTTYTLTYNEKTDYFVNNNGAYFAGRAYAVKEATVGKANDGLGIFVGPPFNGILNYTLAKEGQGFNLIGNPYPSAMDLDKFYTDNQAVIGPNFWFWDNRDNEIYEQQGSSYSGINYAVYNVPSGTGNPMPRVLDDPRIPTEIVRPATGFLVQVLENHNGLNVEFKNEHRSTSTNSVNFSGKTFNSAEKDRYWLILNNNLGLGFTSAVVYFENGNNGFSVDDSEAFHTSDELYSLVDDQQLVIQGKSSFVNTDVVPLGYRAFNTGTYRLGIWKKEGVFNGEQKIYLRDKQIGIIHDLTQSTYEFKTHAGEFNNRFEIIYKPTKKASQDAAFANVVQVQRVNQQIEVSSTIDKIVEVEFFNLTGRSILKAQSIYDQIWRIPASLYDKQLLIIVVKTEKGEVFTQKLINK